MAPALAVAAAYADGETALTHAGRLRLKESDRLAALSTVLTQMGGIEVFRIDFQHIHQKFPRPVDGFVLEIVAKRPVAKHLKHGVVVSVVAHFLQCLAAAVR